MFKRDFFLFLLFIALFAQSSGAQTPGAEKNPPITSEIKGILFERESAIAANGDSTWKENRITGASITLRNATDSAYVTGTTSNGNGSFTLPAIPKSSYILSISYLGFNTLYKDIPERMFAGKTISLGNIQMETTSIELSEVTITAIPPEMVVKPDTIEFNADAFKMEENAVVEDLLRRLAGIEVDVNGKVTATGKDVKKVLVDGKEFFGNDHKMATRNLNVDIVDKIQVIDKQTEQAIRTGIDDGEKETIINISLKKGMNKGWFGNVNAGAGALTDNPTHESPRYASNAMVSRFREGDNLSLVLNANNTNDNNRSGRGGGGGGITDRVNGGVNLYSAKDKKYKASGSLSYGYSDALTKSKQFRQNILVDSVSYSQNKNENRTFANNMNFNTNIEITPDTFNTFTFVANVTYNENSSRRESFQATMAGDADSTRVNQSESSNTSSSTGWNTNLSMTWLRKFAKKGRTFSLTGEYGLNSTLGDGTNVSLSQFFLQPDRNKELNQESETNTRQNNYRMRLTYSEPLHGRNNTLQLSYSIDNNRTSNIKETFDYDPETGTYSILNTDYSKSLENNYVNQRLGVSFNSNQKKYNYNIGMNIIPSYTQSTSFIKNGDTQGNDSILNRIDGRNVVNYSPQARFRYTFSPRNTLSFNYNGNTRQPSVTQLDPTVDNTNPLRIRSGNPDLLPSFTNNVALEYSKYFQEKQRALNIRGNYSFTMNEIINFTDYEDLTGIQYTRPINENGSWNSSMNAMFSTPLDRKNKLKTTANASVNYRNQIGYVMVKNKSERNTSGTTGIRGDLSISYTNDKIYNQLRGSYNYSNTRNSLEGRENTINTSYNFSYNATFTLPYAWKFSSDINYRNNKGLSSGYNLDELLWNMDINKNFNIKRRQATISLRWVDILQERSNISRNVTASYIEDNEYNSLSGYVLVSFSLRFREMGNKGGNRRPQGEFRESREDAPARGGFGGGNRSGGRRN